MADTSLALKSRGMMRMGRRIPLHKLLSPIQRHMLDPFGPGRLYDTTTKCPICQVKAAKVLYNGREICVKCYDERLHWAAA